MRHQALITTYQPQAYLGVFTQRTTIEHTACAKGDAEIIVDGEHKEICTVKKSTLYHTVSDTCSMAKHIEVRTFFYGHAIAFTLEIPILQYCMVYSEACRVAVLGYLKADANVHQVQLCDISTPIVSHTE